MNEWLERIELAAKVGGQLAKLISELMEAVASRNAKRVDEILDGDFATTLTLKLGRLEMQRRLEERDVE